MRYIRMILIFLASLAICGLIAVSLAMELRAPQGPNLGTPSYERVDDMGQSEEVRLWYSASILGRWSVDGRCQSPDETWIFARRRIIRPTAICEISAFVPSETPAIDLHRCTAGPQDDTIGRMDERLRLDLRSDTDLTTMTSESVDLIRCR